jgi:hypothetical protein
VLRGGSLRQGPGSPRLRHDVSLSGVGRVHHRTGAPRPTQHRAHSAVVQGSDAPTGLFPDRHDRLAREPAPREVVSPRHEHRTRGVKHGDTFSEVSDGLHLTDERGACQHSAEQEVVVCSHVIPAHGEGAVERDIGARRREQRCVRACVAGPPCSTELFEEVCQPGIVRPRAASCGHSVSWWYANGSSPGSVSDRSRESDDRIVIVRRWYHPGKALVV